MPRNKQGIEVSPYGNKICTDPSHLYTPPKHLVQTTSSPPFLLILKLHFTSPPQPQAYLEKLSSPSSVGGGN